MQEPVQTAKFPEISPEISHFLTSSNQLGRHVNAASRKNPLGTKIRLNIRF